MLVIGMVVPHTTAFRYAQQVLSAVSGMYMCMWSCNSLQMCGA